MNSQRSRILFLASAVLVLGQFLVFGPALDGSFLKYDDDIYVYENKNIQKLNPETVAWMFARPYYRSYTPLALLSHAIDYAFWKNDPWGHHLTGLLLHSANTVLMFLLGLVVLSMAVKGPRDGGAFRRLREAPGSVVMGSFIAALLFSLHPLRVESVAWISDRKDLLVAFFLLLSVMSYLQYESVRGTRRALRWFLLTLGLFVLAILSKSIAIVVPFLLVALDGLLLTRERFREQWRQRTMEKAPFLIVSVAFGVLAAVAAAGSQLSDIVARMSSLQLVVMPFYSLSFYPVKILLPLDLTPTYAAVGTPWMAVGALASIVVTVLALRMSRRGRPWLLLVWICFVLMLLPTLTGLSAGIQPWADRYAYVPSVALFLLVGGLAAYGWEKYADKRASQSCADRCAFSAQQAAGCGLEGR
jgi:hypothetical protein